MAEIIDGVRLAGKIKEQAKESVAKLGLKGIKVNLTVLLVGEDPASAIYVKNKEKDCSDVGISSETMRLPTTISEK
jgi:methylenetetrahydrofolate dehydrogenase (NADP+)/methenyltetrahydrofolate cyclohydrolase